MITRRELGRLILAQHAAVTGRIPPGTVWLNANENPEGPPEAAKDAIARAITEAGRYNHRVFPELREVLARAAGVQPEQVIEGTGSTEILHCALDAFTALDRPLVTAWPTWEMARDLVEAQGRRVIKVPLTANWCADVERMAWEAKQSNAGVIHMGNPNNPTSSITPVADMRWLARHLPPKTVLLVDEAYIQFDADLDSALAFVREDRDVIVTRTFSKLYGMAGVRSGFGCARADLVKRMQPFRNNVVSILGARAAMAAIQLGDAFVAERRERRNRIRAGLCRWLDGKGLRYIPPHANFVLIDVRREVAELIPKMLAEGVAVGRRFEAVGNWMRVSIGTEQEMDKFRAAFGRVAA